MAVKKVKKKQMAKRAKSIDSKTPPIKINWTTVDAMMHIQCTGEEIAAVLQIDYDTLQRAVKREKGIPFADYIRQKSDGGKSSLRRLQWSKAKEGNPTMLIWLGKQVLGQKDHQEITGNMNHNYTVTDLIKGTRTEQLALEAAARDVTQEEDEENGK